MRRWNSLPRPSLALKPLSWMNSPASLTLLSKTAVNMTSNSQRDNLCLLWSLCRPQAWTNFSGKTKGWWVNQSLDGTHWYLICYTKILEKAYKLCVDQIQDCTSNIPSQHIRICLFHKVLYIFMFVYHTESFVQQVYELLSHKGGLC